jgi:restriction system protein
MILIPTLFKGSAVLAPLVTALVPLSWLFAVVFAAIAAFRYTKQNPFNGVKPPSNSTRGRAISNPLKPTVRGQVVDVSFPARPRREPAELDAAWTSAGGPIAGAQPEKPDSWSLDVLNRVEWKRFEELCCAYYCEKGIRAETTQLGPDGGIDIRLYQDTNNPDKMTAIVQCKAWSQPVGVKPMRELRGVTVHEKAEKAFFMAPMGYTDEAKAFAAENRITLIDGRLFIAMLQRLPVERSKHLLELTTAGDWTTPTCPSCGERMTARESKRGPFWGCVTYPRCRGMIPMRRTVGSTA